MQAGKQEMEGSLSAAVRGGLACHAAGRLLRAAQFYQQALRDDPRDADALVLLGLVARQSRRYEEAIRLTEAAVELRPGHTGFRLSLAQACLAAGKTSAAENWCREVVESHPELTAAWCCLGDVEAALGYEESAKAAWEMALALGGRSARPERSLGLLLCRRGEFGKAAEVFRAAAAKASRDPILPYLMGAALAAGGRKNEAKVAYREALRLRPRFPEALLNLGNLYYDEGEWAQAVACCREALRVRPDYARAWCNLGNALQMLGALREATACYERSLALDPKTVAAQHNLGNAWMSRRDARKAEKCFRSALAMDEMRAEHHNSLGNALYQQRIEEEAEQCYRRALKLKPDYALAHTNLANVLMQRGRRGEMLSHYERAVELDPESAGSHYNLGLAYLREGRCEQGWREHEWRWDFRELRLEKRKLSARPWKGQALHGDTILLHAEQGLGDTLQFVRYAPLVAERGGVVVLEVQPALARLLRGLPGVRRVMARGEALPEFAWECPLMSLPLAFGTTSATIPREIPYVRAHAEEVAAARQRWQGGGLRVGIAWAGNPRHRRDRERSMPLRELGPLAEVPDISWFSLQKGAAVRQMGQAGSVLPLEDASSGSRDLAETAALVATLDLVISVDTAIAHLAGAMGMPVWVVLPQLADWRWMDEREDSPWYPTARLYRQQVRGEWSRPVLQMVEELQRLVRARIGFRNAMSTKEMLILRGNGEPGAGSPVAQVTG